MKNVEKDKNPKYPTIYVVGPTASGKSEFALRLADIFDSVIISADSMQIYRGLDIGTAKVSAEIRRKVKHELIDVVDCDEEFSVARYAELAKEAISRAQSQRKLPIIVGGTGLYFEALLYPMSFAGTDKNSALRESLQEDFSRLGAQAMHDRLRELDPATAERLHPNDEKRVIRAIEINLSTGKTLAENEDERQDPDVIMVGFDTERAKLYERINDRVEEMFKQGLVREALGVGNFDLQSMQAIGYKEFKDCKYKLENGNYILDSEEEEQIKILIKQHTRNYAKRQLTWFRRYKFVKWFEAGEYDGAIRYVCEELNKVNSK